MKNTARMELIPIKKILFLNDLYPRESGHADLDVVDRYRIARKMGAIFPPIVVCKKGPGYILIDGLHRLRAFQDDDELIRASVFGEMTDKEILVKSVQLNSTHGNQLRYKDLLYSGEKLQKMGMGLDDVAELIRVVPSSLNRVIDKGSVLTNGISGKSLFSPVPVGKLDDRYTSNAISLHEICPTCRGTGQVKKRQTR